MTTSYELKARAALDKYNGEQLSLQILETVPIHYELFSHSVTYRICVKPDGDWSCGKPIQPSQLLGNLNFGNNQQLHMQRLSRHFYFNVSVPVNGRLVVHFQARKSFLRRHEIPPDASRGIVLHPSEAYYVDGNGRIHTFQSQALLLQAPTPDMSMPYNVITLVSVCL